MYDNAKLKLALDDCGKYAENGYEIARNAISELKKDINIIEKNLTSVAQAIKNMTSDNMSEMYRSICRTKNDITMFPLKLEDEINNKSIKKFSIALFGRTMAGKSTLMEVLIQGDGSSIGKGAQRTTRDVRTYPFSGMEITDVPGISAFEGEEDRQIAFEAAQKSDMIIFLLDDDAPQADEADCLTAILGLGKPVICLVNIKQNIYEPTVDDMELFREDLNDKMDPARLKNIINQFITFGTSRGQDWKTLRFEFVHLKAAFLAQRPEWKNFCSELYELSRFDSLVSFIIDEVIENGNFFKTKAFIDDIIVPLNNTFDSMMNQSLQNHRQAAIFDEKNSKLKSRLIAYKNNCNTEISTFVNTLENDLNNEITDFCEKNYKNKNASAEWQMVLNKYNIEQKASTLLNKFSKQCEDELKEIYREIGSEIRFSQAVFSDSKINMNVFVNGKRVWNWSTLLIGTGLAIAGLFVPVFGWIALGVAGLALIGNFIFKDRSKKVNEAKIELRQKLEENVSQIISSLNKNIRHALEKEIIQNHFETTIQELNQIKISVYTLSDSQWQCAENIRKQVLATNREFINSALSYLNIDFYNRFIKNVARMPGYATMLVVNDETPFSESIIQTLKNLLHEEIWIVSERIGVTEMLSQIINCNLNYTNTEAVQQMDHHGICVISLQNACDLNCENVNRIKLATQLMGILIQK